MSRYIDADSLTSALNERYDTLVKDYGYYDAFALGFGDCVDKVENQPMADVVEVVRKPVADYEGIYEVDQFGRVFSIDRVKTINDNGRIYEKHITGKQLKQSLHTQGYKTVSLTKDGITKTIFVHRIVAKAFLQNDDDLPFVNHKDEDKTNNFVENLEWCTASYNRTYRNAIKKQASKIRGKSHSKEHNKKISDGVKRYYREHKEATDNYCSWGERCEE